jgi:intein-encoded DNA endonuclease-like protein
MKKVKNTRKQNQSAISDEICIERYTIDGWSLEKIAKTYKTNAERVSKLLKKKGISIINKQNNRPINSLIFDKINSEESAYWLGFLYADGSISSSNNQIELSLKKSDINHIEKFKKFTSSENRIYETDVAFRFMFSSNKIKQDLINLGCFSAKTNIIKFPTIKQVPKKYLKHFIRGYFDGDGCLSLNKRGKVYKPKVSIIGTLDLLKSIENTFNIKGNIYLANKNSLNPFIYEIGFKDAEGKLFLDYIYNNSKIYLDRKYQRYQVYKTYNFAVPVEKSQELLWDKNGGAVKILGSGNTVLS